MKKALLIGGGVIVVAAAIFVAFLAGLGWEDAVAEDNQQSGPTVEEVASKLTACDNHDRLCHANNNLDVSRIATLMGEDAPADLRAGVADFDTQFDAFIDGNCGVNKQNVVCGLRGLNLNLAVSSIKKAVLAG